MLLRINKITKSYGSQEKGTIRSVLNGVSLHIEEGESIAVLGPSGSGKTTLLNIIGTLDHPDSGEVNFRNRNVHLLKEEQKEEYRNNDIGVIFQLHHLLPQCTLLENLLIPTIHLSDKTEKLLRRERAITLMKRTGLYEIRNQLPGELSGGECQRTAVIRAMVNSPSLLLADEPTGALDKENAERLADLLLDLNTNDKVALIVVTHSLSLASKMDTLYELNNGILVKK